ncbi:hypothetical protein SAMN05428961_101728 [Paenibacillus sp. OK060]|nr:hypothetical protein SAMN05428961_101728 [Paenibacillus sp. OK060]
MEIYHFIILSSYIIRYSTFNVIIGCQYDIKKGNGQW